MKIEVEDYEKIRYLYEEEKMSQRGIAKKLNISRKTVKKYCEGKSVPWERKAGSGTVKGVITPEVEEFIRACLGEDAKEHLKKQQHTARRIYERLVEERGFTGGESTVRRIVAEMRGNNPCAYVPLEFSPGEAFQVDWGTFHVYIRGKREPLQLWCMRECYSGDIYCRVFYRQNQESFLEGLQEGILHYGGAPKKIIFDNARIAVSEGFGVHAKATERYAALAAHYVFKPEFCNVAEGHEKGLVEGLVGFARRNFLVPIPRVNSIDELNSKLEEKSIKYRSHRMENRCESVGERFAKTRAALRPLPPYRFETAVKREARVDELSLVRFEKNRYSVPFRLAGKDITLKAYGNRIEVVSGTETVAEHTRRYGQGKTEYDLRHYMELIARRPRSAVDAAPVRQTVPEKMMKYLEGLGNPHEVVRTLQMYLKYPERVLELIGQGKPFPVLEAALECRGEDAAVPKNGLTQISVVVPDLTQYDILSERSVG